MRWILMALLFSFAFLQCSTAHRITADVQPFTEADRQTILQVLEDQRQAWNQGNLEQFMQTYWKSDSLMFIGKNGVKWGWQATLENYRKSYPDTAAMGQLAFDIVQLRPLSHEYAYLVGKWMLHRQAGNLQGHFDLLLRKMNGRWVIVADHSS